MHPNVHFVSDAHAYMMDSAEVIGVLAGRYDKANRNMYIQVHARNLVRGQTSLCSHKYLLCTAVSANVQASEAEMGLQLEP